MYRKKIIKIVLILLLISITSVIFSINQSSAESFLSQADEFLDKGEQSQGIVTIDGAKVQEASNTMTSILLTIGTVVAVIVGAFLAIKIMFSSADGKAQYKQALWAYVISCIVLFGSFGIWKLAIQIFN